MNFASFLEEGVYYPTLICDACGEPIKDARKAIITWGELADKTISYATGIYHKVRCDPGHKIERFSDELSSFMRQLVYNLKIGNRVTNGTERQLVIDLPEPDDLTEVIGRPNW